MKKAKNYFLIPGRLLQESYRNRIRKLRKKRYIHIFYGRYRIKIFHESECNLWSLDRLEQAVNAGTGLGLYGSSQVAFDKNENFDVQMTGGEGEI